MKHLAQSVLLSGVSALCACSGHSRPPELAKAEPVPSETASASEQLAKDAKPRIFKQMRRTFRLAACAALRR